MKKLIIMLEIVAVTLLAWGFFASAQPQDPAKEEKPTFYRLTPGVYVNGWPRFTITYPKDWVEGPLVFGAVFAAAAPGPVRSPRFGVVVVPWPLPLDKFADGHVQVLRSMGAQDVTLVSDKPSQLRDGTPAREIELSMVRNGIPYNYLTLALKKGDLLIHVDMGRSNEKIGEDLKAIMYSLEFQPGKDEPVKVPPDVQEFLDKWCSDFVSHDVAKVMTHYSDRFLNSGTRKGEIERFWRQYVGSITSQKVSITELAPAGYRAYLTGFVIFNFGTYPITETSIIKENGEWKWYGNQRNVSP
jgi:hypothetical protein